MKLIVGLGNPGRKYEQTRHNVGFVALAKFASLASASSPKNQFEGEYAEANWAGEKVGLLWPQTFMNASGQSVRKAMNFYKLSPSDLLVISDDLDLDVGRLRIKRSGSAGGQKGIADIIRHLASEDFPRMKVGIGRPPAGWQTSDYVLGKFNVSESKTIDEITTTAAQAAAQWVTQGLTETMNQYNSIGKTKRNRRKEKPKRTDISSTDQSDPPGDRDVLHAERKRMPTNRPNGPDE